MAEETSSGSSRSGGAAASGANGIFMKGFLPGLLIGLVVGLTIGAVVPPLLDRQSIPVPGDGGEAPVTGSVPREREPAFEGTGLPMEADSTGEEAGDAAEASRPE